MLMLPGLSGLRWIALRLGLQSMRVLWSAMERVGLDGTLSSIVRQIALDRHLRLVNSRLPLWPARLMKAKGSMI